MGVLERARFVPEDGFFPVGASLRGCWSCGGDAFAARRERDVSSADDDGVDGVGALANGGVEESGAADGGGEGGDEGVEVGLVRAVGCECVAPLRANWLGRGFKNVQHKKKDY